MSSALLLLALALGPSGADRPRPDRHGLVVVPGAVDVVRNDGKGPSVRYEVRESFPAPQTIATIREALQNAGWRAVPGPALARYESSSRGWIDEASHRGRRTWSAQFTDARGDQVAYVLVYSSRQLSSGMEPVYLSVWAWFASKAELERAWAGQEREIEAVERGERVTPSPRKPCPTAPGREQP